jgi:hypothetical protein
MTSTAPLTGHPEASGLAAWHVPSMADTDAVYNSEAAWKGAAG